MTEPTSATNELSINVSYMIHGEETKSLFLDEKTTPITNVGLPLDAVAVKVRSFGTASRCYDKKLIVL